NLLQNPGFETAGGGGAGDAANWTEGANHARASDKFNTGAWSLKSTFRGGGTDTRQTVSIATSTTYTYSGYIWKTNSVGSACLDMNDIVGELVLCSSVTGSWQFKSGTWGSGSNTSATLRLVTDASPTGDIWFDDIAFTGPGGPTSTPSQTPTRTRTPTPGPSPTPPANGGVIGNTFVGYQGWFDGAGSGSPINRWNHWAPGVAPAPGNVKFELYPDTREYTSLFQTNLANLGNGSPAKLFSSYTNQTINLHFSWMQTNNIDGIGLQRFGSELSDPAMKSFRDGITTQVRSAAEANGRLFYIMYDVSGMGSGFVTEIENDWTNTIIGSMNLTASSMYARQNGKPVVSLWGVGFLDRPGTASDWTSLITWFQNQGVYVIGGTPRDWRTGGGDSKSGFLGVYSSLDMISPWTVGMATLTSDAGVDGWMNTYVIPDRNYCATNGIDYQPVIFPGFAWSNWNGGAPNLIPRRAGNLMWRMAYDVKLSNISTVYIAMFDEYDEGTAIAKAAEDSSMIPTNQYFLTLDADGTHMSS
ncbi:MAG: glycoside hydrolase family 71/99-like protein, partial [Phycisphaerales bacterium]|nr:glycoside hydrolase family 71/99-like protein [Phycisphaerales bacterium]